MNRKNYSFRFKLNKIYENIYPYVVFTVELVFDLFDLFDHHSVTERSVRLH